MPRVPTYDQFQASPNTLPQTALAARPVTGVPTLPAEQARQTGRAMFASAQNVGQIALDMQRQADQSRVDEARQALETDALQLADDKDTGFSNLRGANALNRPGGKPLAEEYTGELQRRIDEIAGGLGNDAQRQAFARHANALRTRFYGLAMRHEAEQQRVYENGVSEAGIKLRMDTARRSFSDERAVLAAINGTTGPDGEIVDKGIKQYVADIGRRNGQSPEWVEQKVSELAADAHKEVTLRLMDQSPTAAQAYMNKHLDALGGHVVALQRTLRPAVDREQGDAKGEAIFATSKAPTTKGDFNSAVDWVLQVEGGYVANDAGKGPTKYGINKAAHPGVDIENLTPERARKIYREQYWDGIGADKLPPQMRAVAFDTAVNQGVSTATRLLAQAGDDPQKLIELRRVEYQKLVARNPDKYAKYEKAWMSRLDQLAAGLTGERSLGGMVQQAQEIEDPEQRRIAEARIRHLYQQEQVAEHEAYRATVENAQAIAYAKPGGWRDIPASIWGELKPQDRARMMEVPKHSDPDTLIYLREHPDEWKAGRIEQYRGLLSEADYAHLHDKGNGADATSRIRAAKIDTEQFKDQLLDAGLDKLIGAKKGTPEQKAYIELQARFEQAIEAEQTARNRALSIDEKNALLVRLLKPVKVAQVRSGSLFGWFDGPSSPGDVRAFQVRDPNNILVPDDIKQRIVADMTAAGVRVTPARVLNAYLAMPESEK